MVGHSNSGNVREKALTRGRNAQRVIDRKKAGTKKPKTRLPGGLGSVVDGESGHENKVS